MGVIGLAVLLLFVSNPAADTPPPAAAHRHRRAARVTPATAQGCGPRWRRARRWQPHDDQRRLYLPDPAAPGAGPRPSAIPLLYVGTNCVYLLLAVPFGGAIGSHGAWKVSSQGPGLMVIVYLLLLVPDLARIGRGGGCLILLGGYYAATDGVLPALVSAVLPQELPRLWVGPESPRRSSLARLVASRGVWLALVHPGATCRARWRSRSACRFFIAGSAWGFAPSRTGR